MSNNAETTPVGKLMTTCGFTVAHTGGGCLAWERIGDDGKTRFLICDEGQGLGTSSLSTTSSACRSAMMSIGWTTRSLALRGPLHGAIRHTVRSTSAAGGSHVSAANSIPTRKAAASCSSPPGDPYEYVTLAIQEAGHAG